MVTVSPASIVVIPFPFSDLTGTKLRPAVVLVDAGRNDVTPMFLSFLSRAILAS